MSKIYDTICKKWNEHWPAGTEVELINDYGESEETRTCSDAWVLYSDCVVVSVEGRTGGYDITRLIPINPILRGKT